MRIDLFRMERMQSLHWHRVEYDLSESGVRYDVDRTLAGLARVDATLARLVRKRAPSRRRRSADGHLQ